jgi:nitroimidazol reductase NimA-like FMN-containing flavoprotein (pyridoxamine 5'-phosphate oxidase superfamily)
MTVDSLSRDEMDAFLREAGTGVLSLSDAGETYAIPDTVYCTSLPVVRRTVSANHR